MKIVHVTEAWNGGISTYVNTLLEYQSAGHEVSLVYSIGQTNSDFDGKALKARGVKLYPYHSSRNPLKFLEIALHLKKILREIAPDIVHLHSTFPGVYGRIFKLRPVVYCAHGWSFIQEEGRLKQFVYTLIERVLLARTNAIINISWHEHAAAARALHLPKRIISEVIYTGVRDVRLSQHKPKMELDNSSINAVFVGRLDYKKGFDLIEEFFNQPSVSHTKLYVIGQSRRDGHVVKMENTANITYLGWVDNEDIDAYLNQFDVVIVPSRHEGFGLIVAEAMRNAKPVIVSNAGALPELVEEGGNGYIFRIENTADDLAAIFQSVTKPSLKAMGLKGRKVYEARFGVERFIEDTFRLYAKLR